jgi:NitT/TauT family transport system ATP-binding protein
MRYAASMSARPLQLHHSVPERGDGRTVNSAAGGQGAISVKNLSVEFRRNGVRTVAVQDVDIEIAPGEFTALLGPSGCGKSTLLNVIGGMVRPTRGEVRIDGAPVTEPSARCGVVFQQHSLFPWMTALGNVAFGPRMLGHPSPESVAREFLALVGLEKFARSYPAQLSGGMQQRVGIARALATRPQVLLMDEPFGALDAQTRSIMQEELLKIWSEFKTTVVFVTHDVDEALYLSDRVFAMSTAPGGIKEEIRIDLERPRTPDVALSEKYGTLERRVRRLIREETLKVFNSTSR